VQTFSRQQIVITPWHAVPDLLAQYNLSLDDVLTQVWLITAEEEVLGGAAAVNQCFRYIWWAWPLAFLYRLPGLRQLEGWLYRWIATHRHLMPGSTPTCSVSTAETQKDASP
jgi:predicted DCC family thiol-disulfide oxidoreductase YuxK